MKSLELGFYTLSSSVAFAMLAGCGGSQPRSAHPGQYRKARRLKCVMPEFVMNWKGTPAVSNPSPVRTTALAATIAIAMLPIAVQATCTSNAPPSYQDISQVDITQTGCTGTLTPGPPPTFRCSRFWASFFPDKAIYSQFNLPDRVGTYELSSSLNDIRRMLQGASFFMLLPPEQNVPTDQSLFTISVQHCSVVTSIKIYNWPGDDLNQINNLFGKIQTLIDGSAKEKIADEPQSYSGMFNPWY